LRPFAELVAANEVRWVDGHSAIETTIAAGFVTAPDEVIPATS
jgi:hypothetical protein